VRSFFKEKECEWMYSLELVCAAEHVDQLSAELWEAGTAGIRELDVENGRVQLIAGFEDHEAAEDTARRLSQFSPRLSCEQETDWVAFSQQAWPGRLVGSKFFLCPPWCTEPTPEGRHRLIQTPGMACGTGEHPCTQLALRTLEELVQPGFRVADIGTGSGLLAVAALQLGALAAIGIDPDEQALRYAQQNFRVNGLVEMLVAGFADTVASGWADLTVANISGTVLLAIMDDLLRVTKPGGLLVLTGFTSAELPAFQSLLRGEQTLFSEEWSCLVARVPERLDETAPVSGTSLEPEVLS
jgi:ribosomal protein L11 methyltransferase